MTDTTPDPDAHLLDELEGRGADETAGAGRADADETNPAATGGRGATPARRGRRLAVGVGLGVLLVAAVWGGAAVATTRHLFSGSTISDVDVSGMSPDAAAQAVQEQIGAQLAQGVTVSVGAASDQLVPADSGVGVDAAASVDRLTSFTLNPATILDRLRGARTDAVVTVDSESLRSALNAKLGTLATGAQDAQVTLDGTTPVVTPATTGTGLDVDSSVTALAAQWPLGRQDLELVSGVATPAISTADAQSFVDTTLTPLLSADLTVTSVGTSAESAADSAVLTLTPATTASLTSISSEGGTLSASLNADGLHDAVVAAMGTGVETAAQDATWTIDGAAGSAATATPSYVAAKEGLAIDRATLAAEVLAAGVQGGDAQSRTVALPLTVTEPQVTTAEADWGMTGVVGEYATPYYADAARTQNLTAGAAAINGTVVLPGETFSLTEALGAVDAAHGFTDAGVVTDGQHTTAMGGGLSQIATTVFNAGFEAGMDDVEHHTHNYWFERYPAGREATLWTGVLDVKFKNSTPTAVMVQAWVVDGEVHVRLWGSPYYTVSIDNGTPTNYRAYQTVHDTSATCEPYAGGTRGFDITVTRSRTKPDGERLPDDVLTTSYDSDNPVVCS